MNDAKHLLLEVPAAIPDGKTVARLFAEDGVVELLFLYSVGIEPRYEGHAGVAGFYDASAEAGCRPGPNSYRAVQAIAPSKLEIGQGSQRFYSGTIGRLERMMHGRCISRAGSRGENCA